METFTVSLLKYADSDLRLNLLHGAKELSTAVVAQSTLDQLLAHCDKFYQKRESPDLKSVGKCLFHFLESHLQFTQHVLSKRQACVYFDTDKGWNHLPWEILHDNAEFLAQKNTFDYIPVRLAKGESYKPIETQNRPLHALFMASSPEDVEPVLNYEQEEANIYQATTKHPMRLEVEDSGTLQGLEDCLSLVTDSHFDVVHITGHAAIKNKKSVFLLENDIGQGVATSSDQLLDAFRNSGYYPAALFLSGCHTAHCVDQGAVASMAQTLADAGLTSVLGWAKPVHDKQATRAAEIFYQHLSQGNSVVNATFQVRHHLLKEQRSQWHLLRCYGREASLTNLVSKPQHPGRKSEITKEPGAEYLDSQNQIRVCHPHNYIGHRRLLQHCIKTLKSPPSANTPCPQALLLHGTGGLGKSSTALKLIHRFTEKKTIVLVGQLNEIRLINALNREFGNEDTADTLTNKSDLHYRLKCFFKKHPETFIVLDDFEKNTVEETPDQSPVAFQAEAMHCVVTLMEAIRDSGTPVKLIITSRYTLTFPSGISCDAQLMSGLIDADFHKKCNQLPHINDQTLKHNPLNTQTNELKHTLQTLSGGNPRLLEQLDGLFSQDLPNHKTLLERLEKTQEQFREAIILEALFLCLPVAQRQLLAASSVFRIPVPFTAIAALSQDAMATTYSDAISLGLVERTLKKGQPYERCCPLLHPSHHIVKPELTDKQWQSVQQDALTHGYSEWFEQKKEPSETYLKELFRLAKACQDHKRLIAITDTLASQMIEQHRHYEAVQLCDEALTLTNDWKLHHRAAQAKLHLGLNGVEDHYQQATTDLSKETLNLETHKRELEVLWNYSHYLKQCGQLTKAFKLLEQTLLPAFKEAKQHREVAVMQGAIADILMARGQLDEALRIRREEEIPVYERLGDVRSLLISNVKISQTLHQINAKTHKKEIQERMRKALHDAKNMQIPEVETIIEMMSSMNIVAE